MLHRKTYDALTVGDVKVLAWKATPRCGFIVTQDAPSVLSLWVEGWDESLEHHASYDLKGPDAKTYEVPTFNEAKTMGEVILSQILVANNL